MSVAAPSAEVRRARNSVFVTFGASGLAFSAWASRLPDIRDTLGLTPGQLGTLLLTLAAGSAIGLPLSGRIINRFGARATIQVASVLVACALTVAAIAVDYGPRPMVWIVAPLIGLGIGVWDVSMNHEGADVERHLGRAIMPWYHAAFSAATVVSALIGSLMTFLHVPVSVHVTGTAIVVVAMAVPAARRFLPEVAAEPAAPGAAKGRSAWTERRTLLIGVVVLAAAFTEGTANDWIAIAMVDGHDLPAWLGVLGFATFLSSMTLARILGTWALDRFGRVPVLQVMFAVAIVGSLLVVFGGAVLAFVGTVLWGMGAALGFPVGMSAAADDPARAAARLSVVSTIGYLAFLGGPPLLGYLGDHVGVLHALLAVTFCLIPAFLAVPATRKQS